MFEVRGRVIYIICVIHGERTCATAQAPMVRIAGGYRSASGQSHVLAHACDGRGGLKPRDLAVLLHTGAVQTALGHLAAAGLGCVVLPCSPDAVTPFPLGHLLLDVCHPLPSKCHPFLAHVMLFQACV